MLPGFDCLRKLREAIDKDVLDLVFISDRHGHIIHDLKVVFHGIPHGACYHHLQLNVHHKFKTELIIVAMNYTTLLTPSIKQHLKLILDS